MNCKPGDLAILIKSHAGNEGKIVKVGKFYGTYKFPIAGIHHDCYLIEGIASSDICPDCYMRPVSGLPMDEETHNDIKEPA